MHGGSSSVTTTVNVHVAVFGVGERRSVTVHVTVVVPMLNDTPLSELECAVFAFSVSPESVHIILAT